jgi:hypothetical protein
MAETKQAKGGAGGRLVWLLVLALVGAVFWLASERNARHFALGSHQNALVVSRGRFFPTGLSALGQGDGALGAAYGGIELPAGAKSIPEVEFEDQAALDRALFDLLSGWARAAVQRHDASGWQQADELLSRLTGLPGLTAAQLSELASLRAELGWWSATGDLRAAQRALASARRKLEDARRDDTEHAPQAALLLPALDGVAAQLAELTAGRSAQAGGQEGSPPAASAAKTVTSTEPLPGGAQPSAPPASSASATAPVPPSSSASGTATAPVRGNASAPGSVSSGAPRGP